MMYESGMTSEVVEVRRGARLSSGTESRGDARAVEARKRKIAPESFIMKWVLKGVVGGGRLGSREIEEQD